MNILVTGGAGYVGSHLTEHLLKEKKIKIYSIDNFSNSSMQIVKLFKKKNIEIDIFLKK